MTPPPRSLYNKPWLSVADQVTVLESRGLIIDDRAIAEEFLGFVNYYRFSGYCLAFQDRNDHFRSGVKFSDIIYAYEFDSDLRSLVGDWLELAEIDLRTQSVHLFSEKYHAFGHCDQVNFSNPFSKKISHAEWLTRLQDDTKNSEKERCVAHFKARYLQYPDLPIWAAAEVMTFGSLTASKSRHYLIHVPTNPNRSIQCLLTFPRISGKPGRSLTAPHRSSRRRNFCEPTCEFHFPATQPPQAPA